MYNRKIVYFDIFHLKASSLKLNFFTRYILHLYIYLTETIQETGLKYHNRPFSR